MSDLKNSWHTKLAIGILLHDESELENKLDLLTSIGLSATNEETFKICETFRDQLVDSSQETQRETDRLQDHARPEALCDNEEKARSNDNFREDSQV